jgi:hypothetical protein
MKNIFILILLFISVIGFSQNANTPTTGGGAADGTETIITAGTNVTVTGTGASGTPYVINSTGSSTVTTSAVTLQTPFTNPPASPVEGDTYVNSADVLSWVFDGTTWQVTSSNAASPTYSSAVIAAPYTGVELPVTAGTVVGQVRTQQFNDGQTVDYTWNGAAWVAGVVIDVTEQRFCLNTATPVFTPANLLLPTLAEVTAWVTASTLTDVQKLNGTHLDYFIAGQGGSCDNPDYTWVLNEGSLLVTRVDNSILTVADYTALRALTGYNHDIVAVSDFTYTFNSVSYTTIGGIFKRRHDLTNIENGGTFINGTDGTIWERDWDKINVMPDWWEVGGYDQRGMPYADKNVISAGAQILNGFIFHDGIYNDRDRIQAAIDCRQIEGLTYYTINVNYLKRTYDIDKVMSRYNLVSLDKSGTDNYNYATIKRATTTSTTLAVAMSIGQTTATVANASTYRVGMNLSVLNAAAPFAGMGTAESITFTITGIAGNVITFTPAAAAARVLGSIVVPEIVLIDNRTFNGQFSEYKNGIFDGNKLNGGGQRYPQDWLLNGNIYSGSGSDNTIFYNCHFFNNPAENFTIAQGMVDQCTGEDLDGSFVHISMNNTQYAASSTTGVHIRDCRVDGVCLATDAVAGHIEGAITNSLHTEYVKLENCTFKNGSESIFGLDSQQPNTKSSYQVNNCVFENFKTVTNLVQGSTILMDAREDGLQISNSRFYNCGGFILTDFHPNTSIYKGLNYDQISITNNIFIGTRFYFMKCTNINISGNQILFRDETASAYPDWGLADIDVTNPPHSALFFTGCSKITVHDNIIENQFTEHQKLTAGISIPAQFTRRMKDAGGVDTDFIYEQGISVKNNKILGFHSGINGVCRPLQSVNSLPAVCAFQVVGWEFSNNIIILSSATPTTAGSGNIKYVGIAGISGTVIRNNIIYQQRADNNQCGIWGHNQAVTGTGLLGTLIEGNMVWGRNTNFDITIDAFGNGFNNWNAMVYNNRTVNDIWTSNPLRNHFVGNTRINTTTLPGYTTPKIPEFQTFELRKALY